MNLATHIKDHPDDDLIQEKMGRQAWPQLAFLGADGSVLVKQAERSVAGFTKTLDGLTTQADLAKKAAAGDKTAAADLLIAEIASEKLDLETATKKVKEAKLDAEQAKKAQAALTDLEVASQLKLVANPRDPKRAEALAGVRKHLQAMRKEGRIPTGGRARPFWTELLNGAKADKDAKAFQELLGEAKKHLPDDAATKALLDRAETDLETLKSH